MNDPTTTPDSPTGRNIARIILVLILLSPAIPLYIAARPAVPVHLLRQITPGMTKREVRNILGDPEFRAEDEWQYSRWGNAGWVQIGFIDDGTVSYINDESAIRL